MKIKELVEDVEYTLLRGTLSSEVTEIVYDSRKSVPGCLFVCIKGSRFDSHDLIQQILNTKPSALLVEKNILTDKEILKSIEVLEAETKQIVTILQTANNRRAMAFCSGAFFGNPSKKMTMIGITGTKGKTTTSYMLQSILEKTGAKVGIIGTIGAKIAGKLQKTENTTPESHALQELFSKMVDAGCKYCIMEVSSQGLKQERVAGIQFDIGVFTNFSADHIGPTEHATMEEYLYCKSLLFKQCKLGLINIDDPAYKGVLKDHTCEVVTFGGSKDADFSFCNEKLIKEPGILGIAYDVEGQIHAHIKLHMPGKFNIYNSLVALCIGYFLNVDINKMIKELETVTVRGRVEMIPVSTKFTLIIDYAHNEVSVQSLLTTILEYKPKRIVCVYGGGGNRSKLRRYSMGELCGKMADLSILTCDNPRDEEIKDINMDLKTGLEKSNGKYIEIEDRKQAIWYAMENAVQGDVIILLGKGHEEYQEIKGKKHYFSEREIVEEYRDK